MLFCMSTNNGAASVNRQEGTKVSTLRVTNDETGNAAVGVLTDAQSIKLARALLDAIGFNFDDDTEAQLDELEGE